MKNERNCKQKRRRPVPVIESLEPRILLSADLPGLDVPAIDPDFVDDADVARILAQAEEAFFNQQQPAQERTAQKAVESDPVEQPDAGLVAHEPQQRLRQELVIVDPSVPDYEILLSDMQPTGSDAAELSVVFVDTQRSGIKQISEILATHSDLDAIHLVTHGAGASIRVGSDILDLTGLRSDPVAISGWGGALTVEGDILIYGCNVAETEEGQVLIDTLAEMTRADIAASNDLTGHRELGGDWELEYKTGQVDADVAISGFAQQLWKATLVAPSLLGANDLGGIDEDPVSNTGTLVSALISGQVSDGDGPATGIAVIATDDANGKWQYTTDAGSNWYDFGVVDAGNARLLAADASTSVRFVPDANWNGTVTNGITFRAWDQTSGTAGDSVALTTTHTVRDEFTTNSYAGNDGTVDWVDDWQELGEGDGPGTGVAEAGTTATALEIGGLSVDITGAGAQRQVDLSSATSATLTLDVWRSGLPKGSTSVILAVSSDGANWTDLQVFDFTSTPTIATAYTYDISAYASSTTSIRLIGSGSFDNPVFSSHMFFDDVQVEYVTDDSGGHSAFSAETASCGITVDSADDAVAIGGDTFGSGTEDATITGILTATDDADGLADGTVFTVTTDGANGTASIDPATGLWTYIPDADYHGTDRFTVTVTDDDGFTDTQVVNVTVTPVVNVIDDSPTTVEDILTSADVLSAMNGAGITVVELPAQETAADPESADGQTTEREQSEPPRGANTLLAEPLELDEIYLSVINEAPLHRSGVENSPPIVEEPAEETSQTFLQELKSFWSKEGTRSIPDMSEARFNRVFWSDLDRMEQDMKQSLDVREKKAQISAEVAAGVGIGLTASFLSSILRAGTMGASFLATMPIWHHVDPAPLLAEGGQHGPDALSDDEELLQKGGPRQER